MGTTGDRGMGPETTARPGPQEEPPPSNDLEAHRISGSAEPAEVGLHQGVDGV